MPEVFIIGAGLTGLSTAYFCGREYRIIEKAVTPGGLCGSVRRGACTFDYSGHFLHVRSPEIRALIRKLTGGNLAEIERSAWVFTRQRYVPYPFQANLFALPSALRARCLKAFIERPEPGKGGYPDFLSWSMATFGSGITNAFMRPYNEKLWTVSARRLSADWVAPFVPRPTLDEMKRGAIKELSRRFGYNASFIYPREGGCQAVVDAFARRVPVECGISAGKIDASRKRIELSSGETVQYDTLVSTQPLPALLSSIIGLPAEITACAAALDWNSVYCLNLAVESAYADDREKQWVYFPEKKYPFYRAGIYTNIMPSMAPAGYRTFYVEVSSRPGKNPMTKKTVASILKGLKDARLVHPNDKIKVAEWLTMPCAYVIYDNKRAAAVATIQKYLRKHRICSIGRYGAWEYSFMEKNIIDGKATADSLK